MKLVMFTCMVISLPLYGATRRSAEQDRCNNCNKQQQSDLIPALMLQTFMNVLVNGYVATQSPKNSEEQKQAIVNALNTISNFGQFVLSNAKRQNCSVEEVLQAINSHIYDPEFMDECIRSVMLERVRIRLIKPTALAA